MTAPAHHHIHRSTGIWGAALPAPAGRRGFTLLELIVTLVVLGLLAAIAIPTYNKLTADAELRADLTTNEALARAVGATLVLNRGVNPTEVLNTEVARLTNGPTYTLTVDDGAESYSTARTDMNYAAGGGYLGWATHHRNTTAVMCRVNSSNGTHQCWAHDGDIDTHDGDTALAGATDTPADAPGPPLDVTATGGDHRIDVTWTPGERAAATTVTLTTDGASAPLETISVETLECDPTCTWTAPGLLPDDIYDLTLTSTAGTATSQPVAADDITVAGSRSLIAYWHNGDLTTHPFATWAEGNTLRATLETTPGVSSVAYNMPLETTSTLVPNPARNRSNDPQRADQWPLDLARFEDAWCANRGGGATIAVLDADTYPHTDFGDRLRPVPSGWPEAAADVTGSHGTAVTSLIISQPNATGITGAAPDATVIPYNTNNSPESTYRAWRHANNNPDVDIINNSWIVPTGTGVADRLRGLIGTDPNTISEELAEQSFQAGKVVISATGNEGRNHVYHPAAAEYSIAVGAVSSDSKRWTKPGGGSNYGDALDLVGPGGTNMAAWANDEIAGTAVYLSPSSTADMGTAGTSYATPYVSALAAMVITADPTLTVTEIRNVLRTNTVDLGPNGWDAHTGYGMIDAVRTLHALGEIPAGGCPAGATGPTDVNVEGVTYTQLRVRFTPAPGAASHTVTCTPTGGGASRTATGPTSPIDVTVEAGKAYSCTVTGNDIESPAVEYLPAAAAVAGGGNDGTSCAIVLGGAVRCRGYNSSGQLGNGTYTHSATYTPVTGLTGARDVTVGGEHACAAHTSGTVSCWGDNSWGQLGNGTTTSSPTPVTVTGLTDVVEVDAGGNHTCARHANGTVSCWGFARWGANGNGAAEHFQDDTPVTVTGITDAVSIATVDHSACAARANGQLWCWGDNSMSELGFDRSASGINDSRVPIRHPHLAGVTAVTGSSSTLCALTGGTVRCWGLGSRGQLGGGSNWSQVHIPETVTGIADAVAITHGGYHGCALRAGGTVSCWGWNVYEQLGVPNSGNGGANNHNTPVTFPGVGGVVAVGAGPVETCLLAADGTLSCVGYGIGE